MTGTENEKEPDRWNAYNYCVSFIDLLGQRDAVRGQGLLPMISSEKEKHAFNAIIRGSIGTIFTLQRDAETMLRKMIAPRPDSPLRAQLSVEQRPVWDERQQTRMTTQRWSDGLVSFVCLDDSEIKCPMHGIFALLAQAACLCLLGLARRRPVRGGIDIAWAVELHRGELYGPAVVRAYELESEVAKHPRIVLGSCAIDFLRAHHRNPDGDNFSQLNRSLADVCLKMIISDSDGSPMIHYLGEGFQQTVTQGQHRELYKMAKEFVVDQVEHHRRSGDKKLESRYANVESYFEKFPPK